MAEETSNKDPLLGRRLGEFIITEKLGEGGFGVVYLARQPGLARDAVIKVLRNQDALDQEQIERFSREAKLASRLEHPYTAHIYDFGVEPDGLLWIAMELVRGTPLNILLKKQGSLALERFVPLLDKICEVVHTAHEAGIIHRDIKPANVMVIARAGKLLPKLLDFGIAKPVEMTAGQDALVVASEIIQQPHTQPIRGEDTAGECIDSVDTNPTILQSNELKTVIASQQQVGIPSNDGLVIDSRATPGIVGSPPYMAPEQWLDTRRVSARTDIYALAILCYEVLTGQKPFRGDLGELFRAHMFEPLPPLGLSFPSALNQVLAKAAAKNPEERYATAIDFAAHFRAAAGYSEEQAVVPKLEREVQEDTLTCAPQPIAEAVASLAAARNLYHAREQLLEVVRAITRYIGVLALAAYASVESEAEREPEAVSRLRIGRITDSEWLEMAEELILTYRGRRDAYPIPELVDYFVEGSTLFQKLIERAHARASEQEEVRLLLSDSLKLLAKLLDKLSFLWQYRLVVVRGGNAEEWTGNQMRVAVECRQSKDGVYLLGEDGCALLSLQPLVQVAEPAAGSRPELFFFEGRGRRWARFLAIPAGFEHSDDSFWDWYSSHIYAGDLSIDRAGIGEVTPYPGLRAFTVGDSDLFFGREREAESFLNRLRMQPLLSVVGPSGAGKSSFLQAGIIPGLGEEWRWLVIRPGSSPTATLLAALRREFPGVEPVALAEHLSRQAGTGFLLVVDQFEEVITLCLDQEDRRRFCKILLDLARTAEEPIRVVLTLRDDFLVRARELPILGERLIQGLELLTTPGTEDLIRILTEPARRVGYQFEDRDLPREIAESVAGKQGALPLVAFTASKLWEMRDRQFKLLRRKPYEAMGGVGGALAQHAEGMLKQMVQEERLLVREIFRRLVTSEGTRAVMPRNELLQVLGGGAAAEAALEKLVHARLLSASEGEGGQERVEVVHEALLSAWPRLVKWRQEDAEGARLRDQLQAAARQWDERGRPKGLLWRDEALVEYELWRVRYPGRLTQVEEAFAVASQDEAHRSRNMRRRVVSGALVILLLGLIVLFWQRKQTELQVLNLYEEQGRQQLVAGNYDRALVYLARAYSGGRDSEAIRFMLARAVAPYQPAQLPELGQFPAAVRALAFSSNGLLAVGVADGRVTVLRASDGRILTMLETGSELRSVAFHPDAASIAVACSDGTAATYDLESGHRRLLQGHKGALSSVAYSSDGQLIATASSDQTAIVWDTTTGKQLMAFTHQSAVRSASFDPSGKYLLTSTYSAEIKLWSLPEGRLVKSLAGHRDSVNAAAFSPDTRRILTASSDGTARIWDAESGAVLATLEGHASIVISVCYSADGALILTAGSDRTVRFWEAASGKLLFVLPVGDIGVNCVAYSRDDIIATGSEDGTLHLIDARLETRDPTEMEAFVASKVQLRLVGERIEPVHIAATALPVVADTSSVQAVRTSFNSFQAVVDEFGRIAKSEITAEGYYEQFAGGVRLEMVKIPAGSFEMGSPDTEVDREADYEQPVRTVHLQGFYMSRYEVAQELWRVVMGTQPSSFKGDKLPVEGVSWYDAMEFCRRLSERTGRSYRLPTEAEWEYACRAGTRTPFHYGEKLTAQLANFDGNYPYGVEGKGEFRAKTLPVGSFYSNAFGLFDMHGNVSEWCLDPVHKGYLGAPTDGRVWVQHAGEGRSRILRGGSWISNGHVCRSANRIRNLPETRLYTIGFRVVMSGSAP